MHHSQRSTPLIPLLFLGVCALALTGRQNGPRLPRFPTAPVNAVQITLSSSDGKKDWIDRAVADFHGKHPEIHVNVVHMRSGESMRAVLAGTERPTLWSPVSESWIRELNATWTGRHGKPLLGAARPLVKSALVVALWEPMARALGWPDKPVGWEELSRVALDPNGWAGLAHPEWGSFKFGHAHPDYSTSAMLSVISEIYAAAGKRDGLTEADVHKDRVVRWVGAIERGIVHYGKSSSWLTEKLVTRGPGYLSGTPVYESSVVRANAQHPEKPFRLVAVYPKEGTFWESHPTALVDAEWVTPEQAAAAKLLLDHLTSRPMQELAVQCGFRPADATVPLTAPFDAEHGVDLAQDGRNALAPVSEAVFRAANELWHRVKKKATIALVLDTSGSMSGEPMEAAKRGACELIRHMEKEDGLHVWTFSSSVHQLTGGPVSAIGETAQSQVSGLFADGGTALYDAVDQAFADVNAQGDGRLHAVVVLSDGRDTSSRGGRSALLARLPRVDETESTKIYTIAYGDEADRDTLREISERTNAVMFEGKAKNIQQVYLDIAAYF